MLPLVEDMSEIYAHPLPRVFAIFLFAIEYSMANRRIAYILGGGWAYLLIFFTANVHGKTFHGRFQIFHVPNGSEDGGNSCTRINETWPETLSAKHKRSNSRMLS